MSECEGGYECEGADIHLGLDVAVRVRGRTVRNRLYGLSREQLDFETARLRLGIRRPERGQILGVIDKSGNVKGLDAQGVEVVVAAVEAKLGVEAEERGSA